MPGPNKPLLARDQSGKLPAATGAVGGPRRQDNLFVHESVPTTISPACDGRVLTGHAREPRDGEVHSSQSRGCVPGQPSCVAAPTKKSCWPPAAARWRLEATTNSRTPRTLGRAADEVKPTVAEVAKAFGGQPTVLAISATGNIPFAAREERSHYPGNRRHR